LHVLEPLALRQSRSSLDLSGRHGRTRPLIRGSIGVRTSSRRSCTLLDFPQEALIPAFGQEAFRYSRLPVDETAKLRLLSSPPRSCGLGGRGSYVKADPVDLDRHLKILSSFIFRTLLAMVLSSIPTSPDIVPMGDLIGASGKVGRPHRPSWA
jgi:hypothetical protein